MQKDAVIKKKRHKALTISIIIVLILIPIALICYMFFSLYPSTTEKNCDTIHRVYNNKVDYDERHGHDYYVRDHSFDFTGIDMIKLYLGEKTINNFGLCYDMDEKKWNGLWIIDEEFIRTYVEKYSAEEFFNIYEEYIMSYLEYDHYRDSPLYGDSFYEDETTKKLLKHITETTDIIFSLGNVFDVRQFDPGSDTPINKTSETETVTGGFNVGSDNHIEYRSDEYTTETIYYDGYIVVHRYGAIYNEGVYKWVNGKFLDVKPSFSHIDEWDLRTEGGKWLRSDQPSIDALKSSYIFLGDTIYKEGTIYGISENHPFSSPVRILSTNSSVDKWLD